MHPPVLDLGCVTPLPGARHVYRSWNNRAVRINLISGLIIPVLVWLNRNYRCRLDFAWISPVIVDIHVAWIWSFPVSIIVINSHDDSSFFSFILMWKIIKISTVELFYPIPSRIGIVLKSFFIQIRFIEYISFHILLLQIYEIILGRWLLIVRISRIIFSFRWNKFLEEIWCRQE